MGVVVRSAIATLGVSLRLEGKRIVFTNGCFDVLHRGHLEYLAAARALGDVLVLGLNSDESVRRLKGPDRPVTAEGDRAFVMSSLRMVDHVCVFTEDTPFEMIKELQPSVLVKGGDWPVEKIIGVEIVRDSGGTVQTIPFVTGYSTTSILERIKSL